jgi:hypothetical protein
MFRLGVVLRSTAIIIVPEGTTIVGHSAACEMRKRGGAWALLASFSTRAGLPA